MKNKIMARDIDRSIILPVQFVVCTSIGKISQFSECLQASAHDRHIQPAPDLKLTTVPYNCERMTHCFLTTEISLR